MDRTTYLKMISQFDLLTKEEEQEIFFKVKQGDKEAREKAITANLRLAFNIAKKYSHIKSSLQDLVQAANVGLIKAVDKFNPEIGVRFSTYAIFWIKQAVLKFLNNSKNVVRLPYYMINAISKTSKYILEYRNKYDRVPTEDEIAKHIGLERKDVDRILELMNTSYVSLEDQFHIGEKAHNAEDQLCEAETEDNIIDMVQKLRSREKDVLIQRFGLFGNEALTLEQISEKMNITRERVRQIQNMVVDKLKARVKD